MEQRKFETLLSLIVAQTVEQISREMGLDERTATSSFYRSRVYALLEQEDTKLWHLSPLTLYNMFREETESGTITFPEEA